MDTLIGTLFKASKALYIVESATINPCIHAYEYTVNGVNENNKGMQARLVPHARNRNLFFMEDMNGFGQYDGTWTIENDRFVQVEIKS